MCADCSDWLGCGVNLTIQIGVSRFPLRGRDRSLFWVNSGFFAQPIFWMCKSQHASLPVSSQTTGKLSKRSKLDTVAETALL
jgi:hypothetical protein